MVFMYVHIASIYMVRLGLLLIDIAFIIDGCPNKNRRTGKPGRTGGPGSLGKEVLLSRRIRWERGRERRRERRREKGSAVGEMWRQINKEALLSRGSSCSHLKEVLLSRRVPLSRRIS